MGERVSGTAGANEARSSLREEIRDALLARILDGTLGPGDRLVEMHVAREFRTSQAPVREALRELETMGYVATATYRGTRVREIPRTEMRDAFRVRALLEREAVRTGTETGSVDVAALEAAVAGLEKAAAAGDVNAFVRHDEAFHRTLVAGGGNPVLARHWDLLLVSTRIRALIRTGIIDIHETGNEHRPILEAVARGNSEVAGRLVHEHIDELADRMDTEARAQAGEQS
ncbi:MAG: GntR family transcriptional regulator [Gemmatimonadota bacterium]